MKEKLKMTMIDLGNDWSWSLQKEIQELLFSLDGFGWWSIRGKNLQQKPIRIIFIWDDGFMTFSQSRQYHYEYKHKEITVEQLKEILK